jgi:tetratricopeptide (TPR) repeat protein
MIEPDNSPDQSAPGDKNGPKRTVEKADSGKGTADAIGALWFSLFEYGRKFTINTIVVAVIIIGVSIVGKATLRRSVVFEPISIPKELSDRGFTGEATAKQIVDELTILWNNAATSKRLGVVGTTGPETVTPKIEVPGIGISIDTIVYYLRDLLGRADTKISGEITIEEKKPDTTGKANQTSSPRFNLRLRIVDQGFVYLETEPTDDLHVLFKRAALPLMEQIDPYIAGLTYRRQKDFIPATRMAEIQLRTGTIEDQQWAHNLLASIAEEQNRMDIAKDEYKNLSARFPNFPLSQYNLGHLLHTQGNYQESIQAALKGAHVDRNVQRRAIGYGNVGAALYAMRKSHIEFDHHNANAAEILLSIGEIVKDDGVLAAIRNGGIPDSDLIIALCKASAEADPVYAAAYRLWGEVERDRENFLEATGLFEKSIAAKPTEPFGYRDMGGMYISQGDWDNAAAFFQKAVNINPDSYYDHYSLGRSLGESGKYDAAIAEFQTALGINPKWAWSHLSWAQTLAKKAKMEEGYAAAGTRSDAVQHLKTASKLLPDSQVMTSEIATTYEALGMVADAAAVYGKN